MNSTILIVIFVFKLQNTRFKIIIHYVYKLILLFLSLSLKSEVSTIKYLHYNLRENQFKLIDLRFYLGNENLIIAYQKLSIINYLIYKKSSSNENKIDDYFEKNKILENEILTKDELVLFQSKIENNKFPLLKIKCSNPKHNQIPSEASINLTLMQYYAYPIRELKSFETTMRHYQKIEVEISFIDIATINKNLIEKNYFNFVPTI